MLDVPYTYSLWGYNLTFSPFLYGIMILLLSVYTNEDIFASCICF